MSIKDKLIRLGYEQPELRNDLRPILDEITSGKTASRSTVETKLEDIFDSVKEQHSRDNYVVWEVGFPGGQVEAHYDKDDNKFKITDPQGQQVWYTGSADRSIDWGPVRDAVSEAEKAQREGKAVMVYFKDSLLLHF